MTSIPDFNFIFRDDNSILKPIGWPKLKKRIDKQLERADKLIAKVKSEEHRSIEKAKSEQLTSTNNSRNLPNNATIRKEYVRCGKSDCQFKHGPYYYAYWKDNGKTNKKYIGKYPPPVENTSKDDESSVSKVTVNDPSHTSEGVE